MIKLIRKSLRTFTKDQVKQFKEVRLTHLINKVTSHKQQGIDCEESIVSKERMRVEK